MASGNISPQILLEKGSLGIHYFISKHDSYFEPLECVMGGWAALDLCSVLSIKSELHCRHFALLCNSEISFHKTSDNRMLLLRTSLYQTGA